jgi:diguanylate cyclase (GGDEF)-like protein
MDAGREKGLTIRGDGPSADVSAFRALHDVTKHLHASLDLTETLDRVASGLVSSTSFRVAALSLYRPDGFFEVVSVEGSAEGRAALLGTHVPLEEWKRIEAAAEPQGDSIYFLDSRHAPNWADGIVTHRLELAAGDHLDAWLPDDGLFAVLTAPSGECVGLLSVDDPVDGRRPTPAQIEILELFADHAAIAIQHAHLHSTLRLQQAELRHAATHDTLTGIANRALLNSEGRRMAAVPDSNLAVVAIDLDDFKSVNDSAGHQAGDEVLAIFAKRLLRVLRPNDLLARVGGDEFVLAINERKDVHALVHSLVGRVEETARQPIRTTNGLHRVGASIGSAVSATPCDFGAMLREADAQMYERKRTRRARRRRRLVAQGR